MPSPPSHLVLTLLGPDRPGLVEILSDLVKQHGGNWVESRMARLGGQFAGILRIELDAEKVESFRLASQKLEASGLTLQLGGMEQEPPSIPLQIVNLELMGQDRPGIVREISRVLREHEINVEELTTGVTSAPMSGEALFFAKARLGLPEGVKSQELRESLERLAADLMVDLSLVDPG